MHFHIITLFPGAFSSYLGESIVKRALSRKQIQVSLYNPRDYTDDPHRRVDGRPYGGGPGMVLEPMCVLKAVAKAIGRKQRKQIKVVFFEPGGTQFDTAYADHARTTYRHLVLICGRYEGIDARVKTILQSEPVSIGPYTLTGGELPALIVLDAITRRLPGVLGDDTSVEERRVASHDVYTRPEILTWKRKQYSVPKVLLSGNHHAIEMWKTGKQTYR